MSENEVVVDDKDVWLLGAALSVFAFSFAMLIVCIVLLIGSAQSAAKTHNAICTFREQLITQLKSGEKYLAQHPEGAPALHLSAASIQQSINKEQAAVNSLSGLDCSQ